jgi:two-component system cell cycle response regulator
MRVLDEELWRHAGLVASLVEQFAKSNQLSAGERAVLIDAAWLHDIGKLTVPRSILDKPGPLDATEWAEMREHANRGANFLARCDSLREVAPLVRHHHERFDGGGYPGGMMGNAVPRGAQIIGVVDAFNAMTTHRPYRGAMPVDAALDELQRCAGSQFDPEIVESFLSLRTEIEKGPGR